MISSTFRSFRPIIEALPSEECRFFSPEFDIFERLRSFLKVNQNQSRITAPIIADILHTSEEEILNLFYFSFENTTVPMSTLDEDLSPSDRKKLFLHIIDEIIANNRISFTLPDWVKGQLFHVIDHSETDEELSDQKSEEPSK